MSVRPLYVIADEIQAHHPKAKDENQPIGSYCVPMLSLNSIDDPYYFDTGRSVVRGFLANAAGFKGEVARRIKAELKAML